VTRRQNQRYLVDLDVDLRIGENTLRARAKNLSLGGVYLELAEKTALGERVHLRFTVAGHAVEVDALVRWHGDRGAGVQFDSLRARDVYEIGKYLETLS
jgi:hypothetical protein